MNDVLQFEKSLRSKLVTTAALAGALVGFFVAPVAAHFPTVQGTTAVNPTGGAPGSSVKVSAAGAQQGYPYSLMFADPSQVSSFEQGGGGAGHKEACAHGSPIAGPFTPDGDGNIKPVEATIPPSSSGRALICFQNGNSLTRPVEFTVEGSMSMQPR
jgi:hypothetical protein